MLRIKELTGNSLLEAVQNPVNYHYDVYIIKMY